MIGWTPQAPEHACRRCRAIVHTAQIEEINRLARLRWAARLCAAA